MTGRTARLALVLALVPLSASAAQLPDTLPGQALDTLPRQVPAGPGDLAAKVAGVCRVQIAAAYRYLGGQRFILQEAADAEQHFYARADSGGKILQLYWFQVESKLPGQGAGYNYGRDSAITINDIPFAVSLREARGDAEPAARQRRRRDDGLRQGGGSHLSRDGAAASDGAHRQARGAPGADGHLSRIQSHGQGRSDLRWRLQAGQARASLRRLPLTREDTLPLT